MIRGSFRYRYPLSCYCVRHHLSIDVARGNLSSLSFTPTLLIGHAQCVRHDRQRGSRHRLKAPFHRLLCIKARHIGIHFEALIAQILSLHAYMNMRRAHKDLSLSLRTIDTRLWRLLPHVLLCFAHLLPTNHSNLSWRRSCAINPSPITNFSFHRRRKPLCAS